MRVDRRGDIETFLSGHQPSGSKASGSGRNALWLSDESWEETDIPPRPWIAPGYFLRRSLSVISGAGSAGKSSLVIAWTASLAIGEAFHRMHCISPRKPLRVMSYNVEDDLDELRRRYMATLRQMNRSPQELMRNLTLIGPHGSGALLTRGFDGDLLENTEAMNRLEEVVAERKPDVLFLDPFVELHNADENDNTAVRAVLAKFRAMAVEHDMAVVLLHHSRKGAASAGDPESMRGASAIAGAARVVLTLNVMTEDEAKAFEIPPDRRRYYARLDGAKMNYCPITEAEWFERHSYVLDNGPLRHEDGDGVGIMLPWSPPSRQAALNALTDEDYNRALDRISAGYAPGKPYTSSKRGRSNHRWAGHPIKGSLGLGDAEAATVLAAWINSGLLFEKPYHDTDEGKTRTGLAVDDSKRPGA